MFDGEADINAYEVETLSWELRTRTKDVMVWSSTIPDNPWDVVCGQVEVAASVQQLVSLLADYNKRASYDTKFRYAVEHGDVDAGDAVRGASLRTLVYAGAWPVADRQFRVLSAWSPWHVFGESDPVGAIVSSRSVLSSAMPGPVDSAKALSELATQVCARIHVAGFAIYPLEGNTRCNLTMVSHINFGGNMPSPVINLVQTKVMPEMLQKISAIAPLEVPTALISSAFQRDRLRRG